jgi:hypothetical protein
VAKGIPNRLARNPTEIVMYRRAYFLPLAFYQHSEGYRCRDLFRSGLFGSRMICPELLTEGSQGLNQVFTSVSAVPQRLNGITALCDCVGCAVYGHLK